MTVSNDATNIYVTYVLDYQDPLCPGGQVDAVFGTLHLWIGNSLLLLPSNNNGTPIPGQFPYHADATGLTTYTFVVPFAEVSIPDVTQFCNSLLFVVTHAEVDYLDCQGQPNGGDTAFGGTMPGSGPRWWFYDIYSICCDFGPPGADICRTAYAKGGYIWTTQRRSNPEGLPSLSLTANRWGWAINLSAPGITTYDIWAGAGLNNTANGVRVGTLTVDWDGAEVDFCYNLNTGYTIKEVHVYANDLSPTTIAPGQYGYTEYFEPPVSTHCDTLPLADTNTVGGVWFVAHAVVCSRQ